MLEISVVINTKDRAAGLCRCLAALQAQTLDPQLWEIIVVDDGSRDDQTVDAVASYHGKAPCQLIRREHRGCSAARNTGIDAASGRIILFLGDDILTEPDLLEEHLAAHARWPKSAVVGPYIWEKKVPSPPFLEYVESRRFDKIRDPLHAGWRFFYTGNASVERQALLAVDGFDENFFRYAWEDMDIGVRLERAGVAIIYDPEARAVHDHPFVSLPSLCRAEYEQAFSAWYFFDKWKDAPEIQADRFWKGNPAQMHPGPAWRKTAARAAIHAIEAVYPASSLLRPLYARLIWSCRYEGLRHGAQHYGPIMERWRAEQVPPSECYRRFQR